MLTISKRISRFTAVLLILVAAGCSQEPATKDPISMMKDLLPESSVMGGLDLVDSITVFERNTVWDHLGRPVETYLNNGLLRVSYAKFVSSDESKAVAVDVMNFRETLDAFTMYALFRDPGAKFVGIGQECSIAADTLWLIKGHFLGRIVREGDITDQLMSDAARSVADKIKDTANAFPSQLALFPENGKIAHSETMRPMDQMPFDEPPAFFGCSYVINSDSLKLYFLQNSKTGLPTATEAFIGIDGKADEWLMEGQYQSLVGSHPARGNVYCAVDNGTLAVVTGYDERQTAKDLVESLFEGMKTR